MGFSANLVFYLIPAVLNPMISVVMIPLTTTKLFPEQFGMFALLSSFATLVVGFSSIGSGYIWAANYPKLELSARSAFVTTLIVAGILICCFWATVLWLAWPVIQICVDNLGEQEKGYYGIGLISAVLSYPWYHAVELLTLEGRARAFAYVGSTAAVASAVVTLVCLYILDQETAALFWGLLASSASFFVGAMLVLSPYLGLHFSTKWVVEIIRKGLPTTPGNAIEPSATVIERNILTANLSLYDLGLFTHSQSYRGMVGLGIKALARTVWPISLEEVTEKSRDFCKTRAAWVPVFFLLTLGGIVSAGIGKEGITLLTHGRFTESAMYVTPWFLYIAIQNTGKEKIAILYSANCGIFLTYANLICQLISIGVLFVLIPRIGVWGAIVAAILQQVAFRTAIQWKAQKAQDSGFNDWPALLCSAFVLLAFLAQILFWNEMGIRVLTCCVLTMMCLFFFGFFYKNILRDLTNLGRRPFQTLG
jgi:O-antigen/teichoic acid export membrane protein